MSRNAREQSLFCAVRLLKATLAALLCFASDLVASAETYSSGSNTARVVVVADPRASEAFRPDLQRISTMVERGIVKLTGKATPAEAWRSVVSTHDVIGLKVYSMPGPNVGTRPAVAAAVITGLLEAGMPASNIVIWDKHPVDLRLAGFLEVAARYDVRTASAIQSGYDEQAYYESPVLGNLVWGDSEFGKKGELAGRKSFVCNLVSKQLTKIINISPMLNHNLVGVSGNIFSLVTGSVDNTLRFEISAERMATTLPEIYAMAQIGDKVALNIVDALVCQYEGGERGLLHYSATLNELRFSKDPVALDTLSVLELDRLRGSSGKAAERNIEMYNVAAFLDLGVSEKKKIRVERLD